MEDNMKPNLIRKLLILLLAALLATTATACQPKELYTEEQFKLHTLCQITTYGKLPQAVYDEIWAAMDTIDSTMSMTMAESELKAINDAAGKEPVKVSDDIYYVIERALQHSDRSSTFDITIGPVVALWGIGSDNPRVPGDQELQDALALVNYKNVVLNKEDQTVYLTTPGMQLDLGAIAKGFAADKAKEVLVKNKVKQAIINWGGNILVMGTKQGNKPWQIGVQHPDQTRGAFFGVIPLTDKTIVTSGTYERFFEADGKRYHHLLDTKTGYPTENGLISVSIITEASIDADAMSTQIFNEGLESGLAFIESIDNVEAIFVTSDHKVYLSSGLKDQFQLVDDMFTLMP